MRRLLNLALVVFIGGFAAAALVRYSPGFDVDENSWNPKISAATLEAMHAAAGAGKPVADLLPALSAARRHMAISENPIRCGSPLPNCCGGGAPVTVALVGWGTAAGLRWEHCWPGCGLAAAGSLGIAASFVSGLLLAIPPAVLALAFFFAEAPLALAMALAVLPRVFGTLRALFEDLFASPALLAARARGVGPAALATRYVLCPAAPRLIALAGVAAGSRVRVRPFPSRPFCDVPGSANLPGRRLSRGTCRCSVDWR